MRVELWIAGALVEALLAIAVSASGNIDAARGFIWCATLFLVMAVISDHFRRK